MNELVFAVEPFQPSIDVPIDIALIHLGIRQWQVEVGQNTFSDILESQVDLGTLDEYYVTPGGNFFIAKGADTRVIGFVGLRNDGEGHGVIKRLSVVPEQQRRGIGKALVGQAIEWAKQNGFTTLSLHTNIGENARPLYEQFGFKVTGFVKEHGDWAMELDLAA